MRTPDDATRVSTVDDQGDAETIMDFVRMGPIQRLRFEEQIASGGMGSIQVAHDRALGRRLAKKVMHPHLRTMPGIVRMFLREARINALLDHPNLVPVYDIGEAESELYFTMKLVSGQPLKHIIQALPPGPIETTTLFNLLDVCVKVCDALAFAHAKGVLHLDVKPDNVMVGDYGQVYLMDWGVARLAQSPRGEDDPASSHNSVIGTPPFMSPEQALGNRAVLDSRADVFLVGATLYYLLARRPPYQGTDTGDTIRLAVACDFLPPRAVVGDRAVPQELERIVLKAMSRERSARYPTTLAMKEDLLRYMRGGAEFPQTSFTKGTYIVREGDPGDSAFIIVSGRCEVRKRIDGVDSMLQVLGPGDVFGEMAALTEGPRTASVLAIDDTTVLVVTGDVFDREIDAMKPWIAKLVKSQASRMRELYATKRVTLSAGPSVPQVAYQILMTMGTLGTPEPSGALRLPWSMVSKEIEGQLGAAAAMRIFAVAAQYRPAIALDVPADEITVPDPAALLGRVRGDLSR
jgi:serine/threonine-protein kinase